MLIVDQERGSMLAGRTSLHLLGLSRENSMLSRTINQVHILH